VLRMVVEQRQRLRHAPAVEAASSSRAPPPHRRPQLPNRVAPPPLPAFSRQRPCGSEQQRDGAGSRLGATEYAASPICTSAEAQLRQQQRGTAEARRGGKRREGETAAHAAKAARRPSREGGAASSSSSSSSSRRRTLLPHVHHPRRHSLFSAAGALHRSAAHTRALHASPASTPAAMSRRPAGRISSGARAAPYAVRAARRPWLATQRCSARLLTAAASLSLCCANTASGRSESLGVGLGQPHGLARCLGGGHVQPRA
jgi:hypothetical protein